ncbi:threonine aldolase family protein [Caproicibacter fermentans]|uniref:Low specificity L-threonine aldolase n=1 Tax=Caproicibacter fermentans TaxID=2576756 RepID=A0A7G8T947_9FIRM|nr:low specificity L-threonine aldolase [Caproicibacter fermentans]QNK40138.1 low specificity L-threonine aldolase [Caproicibacter fermentans]
MIRFNCDYSEGAHPKVLELLSQTNLEQTAGYGEDPYCRRAAELIRQKAACPDADVQFTIGGTQVNLIVIAASLRPHQGALCADTGHINVHESGAVEATGHKVLPVPGTDGKITAAQIQATCDAHFGDETHEHMVQPGMAYLSFSTELGTIYSKKELTEISETCRRNGLLLYVDGARLGYGLSAEGCDLTLPALAGLCDAFTIGGTKVGALFGEALVIRNSALKQDFRYILKQRGGMLAKGRLLGIQFLALLENDLYFDIAARADRQAMRIHRACAEKGWQFLSPSPTNQQFPVLPDSALSSLRQDYEVSYFGRIDESHSAVRFCTSWATRDEDVERLVRDISAL